MKKYENLSLYQLLLVENEDPENFKNWTREQFLKLINWRKKIKRS